MEIEKIYSLFEKVREVNKNPFTTKADIKKILESNPVAKNIYIQIISDSIIKNDGLETFLFECKNGKISLPNVKESFKETGFVSGLAILKKANSRAKLGELDLEYYQLESDFEKSLAEYVEKELKNIEFQEYLKSISFEF